MVREKHTSKGVKSAGFGKGGRNICGGPRIHVGDEREQRKIKIQRQKQDHGGKLTSKGI